MSERCKIFIVDDSLTALKTIEQILKANGIIGVQTFTNPHDALEALSQERPSLVIADIMMEGMDGFEFVSVIHKQYKIPAIIVSAFYRQDDKLKSMRALEVGALAIIEKPLGTNEQAHRLAQELIGVVKGIIKEQSVGQGSEKIKRSIHPSKKYQIVGIGASLGGPRALQYLFQALPESFPLPIVVVQHISVGFDQALVTWLSQTSNAPISLARVGQELMSGHVYLAPCDRHIKISNDRRVMLTNTPPIGGLRPSIDVLFESLASVYKDHVIALLLTGMGRDGVIGLKALKEMGSKTIAQAEPGCEMFGMPKSAIDAGVATDVVSLEDMAYELNKLGEL